MSKERLDILLVDLGLISSREKAKKTIMAGLVFVDEQRVDKAGTKVKVDAKIEVRGKVNPYVSRGGLKLDKAIKEYNLDLTDCVCMDIGASTGGFTDCMLQNGATKVYSVDVGYGQLDWKLRQDERVVNMERTNIRYIEREKVTEALDFVSIDVSFISLDKVLPVAKELLSDEGEIVFLIKPQFEAGREKVGKNGVIRDAKVHKEVLNKVLTFASDMGFKFYALTFSPIKGPKGNIEFLCYATVKEVESVEINVDQLVDDAHAMLHIK